MKLNQVEKLFKLCFASNVTPALVGTSGVGKTSICKQVAENLGFKKTIVLRPSVIADVGDLVGLPDFEVIVTENGSEKRTKFNAPDWLPLEGEKALIIVDEINRTQKDIIMAMFDLIEAEKPKIGSYVLPEGCKVVATLNPPTDNYTVLDIKDSAFTSRLCFIKVVPNQKVFTDWGRKTGNLSDEMIAFLAKNDQFFGLGEKFEVDMFFGSSDTEKGDHFKNNNRSKKKVSDLYSVGKELGMAKGIIFEAIRGVAGLEAATAFTQFADTYSTVITLEDILTDKEAAKNFDYSQLSNVSKIIEDLKHHISQGKYESANTVNLATFMTQIPLDTFKGFYEFLSGYSNEDDKVEKYFDNFVNNDFAENDDIMTRIDQAMEVEAKQKEEDKEESK